MSTKKVNLLNFDLEQMQSFFVSLGEKPFRAVQALKWIHQYGLTDFNLWTNISVALREKLQEMACIIVPEIVYHQQSTDGTQKWLLKLADQNCIETVFIPENDRGTLCVSSQVGCALNCSFCVTGAQGFNRNLTAAEIIGQVWVVQQQLAPTDQANLLHSKSPRAGHRLTNVVMMGMGEPLLNYQPVLSAMRLMLEDNAYGLSKYRVTLSTSGLVPEMERLAKDIDVALALSLHAPNNPLRNELVPINKKYPIEQLMQVCKNYFGDPKRKVTMEYVMLAGINDSLSEAKQLAKILCGIPAKVNLIPFNPNPFVEYTCSSTEQITAFRNVLLNRGIHTITRKTRGQDIKAACGQLRGDFLDRTKRSARIVKQQGFIPTCSSNG